VKIIFTSRGWEDYRWWQTQDRAILRRVNKLIDDICRNGYTGIGKPEALRENWSGYWSRRITDEHRLIYRITDDAVYIAVCRYHY